VELRTTLTTEDLRDVHDAAHKVWELFEDPAQWVQKQYNVMPMSFGRGINDDIPGSCGLAGRLCLEDLGWLDCMNVEKVLPHAKEIYAKIQALEPSEDGFNEGSLVSLRRSFERWIPQLEAIAAKVLPRPEGAKPSQQYCSIGAVEFVMPHAVKQFRVAMYHYLGIEYVEWFNDNHTLKEIRNAMLDLMKHCRKDLEEGEESIDVDISKLRLDRATSNWHYCE
jgi:hypothetical protein